MKDSLTVPPDALKVGHLSTSSCPFQCTDSRLILVPMQLLRSKTHLNYPLSLALWPGLGSFLSLFPHFPLFFLLNPRRLIRVGKEAKESSVGFPSLLLRPSASPLQLLFSSIETVLQLLPLCPLSSQSLSCCASRQTEGGFQNAGLPRSKGKSWGRTSRSNLDLLGSCGVVSRDHT